MRKFIAAIIILFAYSCQKPAEVIPPSPDGKVDTVFKDLSYGSNDRNKLDLYLPAGRTTATPVIVLIHGGSWREGNKADLSFFGKKFQAKGFAVANINYRLSPASDDNFKMQLDDIQSAISFLLSGSEKYIFSSQRFYTTGHSAGGHLSLSYAYTRNENGLIKAAAGMAAPTDLYNMAYYNPVLYENILTPYLGAPLSSATADRYKAASPYYQATAASVPTILFQGDVDFIVNKDQANFMESKLNQVNVPNKKKIYPLTGHDWWQNGDFVNDTVNESVAWFDKYR